MKHPASPLENGKILKNRDSRKEFMVIIMMNYNKKNLRKYKNKTNFFPLHIKKKPKIKKKVTVHRDNSSKSPDDKPDSSLLLHSGLPPIGVKLRFFTMASVFGSNLLDVIILRERSQRLEYVN
jgi:hypothetical protein